MDYTTVLARVKQTLEQRKDSSAWSRGVTKYAVDMLQQHMDAAGVDTLAGLDYKITYKAVTSSRLDSKSLKADQPELYAKYTKQTTARRFCLA